MVNATTSRRTPSDSTMAATLASSHASEEPLGYSVEMERFGNDTTARDDRDVEASPSPHATAAAVPHDATNPFARLPDDQADILKRQVVKPETRYGFWAIFRFASGRDVLVIIVSAVLAAASGAAMPIMTIIFGGFQKVFQDYLALGLLSLDEFRSESAQYVLYFVYLAIGSFFATYLSNLGFLYTGEHIATTIRQRYLEACLRQNIGFFDHLGAGEITVKITADANRIQDGISEKLGLLVSCVATLVAAFLVAFLHAWKLTLILSSAPVAILLNTAIWTRYLVKLSIPMAISSAQAGNLAHEAISAIRVLMAFAAQDHQIDKYDTSLKSAAAAGVKLKAACAVMVGIVMGLAHLSYGLGFWQGSLFVAHDQIDFQDMVTTLMSLMIGSFNIGAIGPCLQVVNEAVATSAGFLGTIDRESPLDGTDILKGEKPTQVEGHICLKSVKHIYPSRPEVTAMDNVTLDIPSGKVTALVGASGSGKSTIIGLIERFYNPVDGKILLDGRDINTLNLRWMRQQIGLVAQEPVLFSGTIFENIRFGLAGSELEHPSDEIQRDIVINAAKSADAHEFISQLSDGYETNVGQRGSMLSGGQKQRIAIARAIVSNPKILLLDEATSALDTKSEGIVQAALERVSQGRTTIAVAHRLSTVRHAHNIVVMSGGRIVEQGTHDQLMGRKGAYYELVTVQQVEKDKPNPSDLSEKEDPEEEELVRKLSKGISAATSPSDSNAISSETRRPSFSRKAIPKHRFSGTRGSMLVDDTFQEGNSNEEQEPEYGWWCLTRFLFSFNKLEAPHMVGGFLACVICGLAPPTQAVFFAKQMITIMNMENPLYNRWERQQESNFWSLMFLMLGCVTLVAHSTQGSLFAYTSEILARRVKQQSLKHILHQDVSFFDREKNSAGALTAFLAAETTQMTKISGGTIGEIIIALTSIIAGIATSIAIGWKLALVCVSVLPLLITCGFLRSFVLKNYTNRAARLYADSASSAAENIAAIKTVAALTLEGHVAKTYCKATDDQRRQSLVSTSKSSAMYALSHSMTFLSLGLGFWYGSTLLATQEYDIFQFFVCLMSIILGATSTGQLLTFIPDLAKARGAAAQVKLLVDRVPAIDTWDKQGQQLKEPDGHLEFQHVYFRYPTRPEKPILRGLDLTVLPGQHVALVGPSGCGKSTCISLLERFYDPTIGRIMIDGVDITKIQVNEYRSHMALVSQEPALFQGSIRDNILIGTKAENISEETIKLACQDANIHDFVMSLPSGLDTEVGSAGTLLSGGQKQRIAIARAIIRQPKVLLLDEATSALESESEHVIQTALDRAAKGRTTVTIAHRLATIRNADKIFFLDQGRIAEAGTHQELMALNGRYAELVKMQSLG